MIENNQCNMRLFRFFYTKIKLKPNLFNEENDSHNLLDEIITVGKQIINYRFRMKWESYWYNTNAIA